MLYQSQKMKLESIRIVKQSPVNDIVICRDLNTAAKSLYTLLVIKSHKTARLYLDIFEKAQLGAQDSYIESFSAGNAMCMVFEYKQERPLDQFFMGNTYSLSRCEKICNSTLLACMSSRLPYPILYLALKQNQLHLSEDDSVYLSYQLDLSELDAERTESDCVVACAEIIQEMLVSKPIEKATTISLLKMKTARRSYRHFAELYKDLQLTEVPVKRAGIFGRIKGWFKRNQNVLFRLLLALCVFLLMLVIVSVISQLIFGDIPWLRLIFNGFKNIGTESLLQ